jgi:hypothetical protein
MTEKTLSVLFVTSAVIGANNFLMS